MLLYALTRMIHGPKRYAGDGDANTIASPIKCPLTCFLLMFLNHSTAFHLCFCTNPISSIGFVGLVTTGVHEVLQEALNLVPHVHVLDHILVLAWTLHVWGEENEHDQKLLILSIPSASFSSEEEMASLIVCRGC